MLPGQKEDAETLRVALGIGFATVADVVAWADGVIEADPRPDWAILDVSLGGGRAPHEMTTLLRDVAGEADHVRVMRRILARLLRALDADPSAGERIAGRLYRLASAGELPEEHFGWDPYSLDDAFELARIPAHGTMDDALRALHAYLVEHAAADP